MIIRRITKDYRSYTVFMGWNLGKLLYISHYVKIRVPIKNITTARFALYILKCENAAPALYKVYNDILYNTICYICMLHSTRMCLGKFLYITINNIVRWPLLGAPRVILLFFIINDVTSLSLYRGRARQHCLRPATLLQGPRADFRPV
jgi:hypothetical protein